MIFIYFLFRGGLYRW